MTEPIEIHEVPNHINPIRLQEYGVGIFKNCPTKSSLKKRLKKGLITVNNQIGSTATYISGNEIIKLYSDNKSTPVFPLKLKILYEDDYLAVIHKPPGILVSGNSFQTVTNALEFNLTPSISEDATRPLPIHRLDYATTGALLIGKTGACIRTLYSLFEKKEIQKVYIAITIGEMRENGIVDSEIENKSASSLYKKLASVPSERFKELNLIQLKPETGRRHQLRKHLHGIGNPILGDKDYFIEDLVLKGKGMYLHAYLLKFKHPISNENLCVVDDHIYRFEKIFPEMMELI